MKRPTVELMTHMERSRQEIGRRATPQQSSARRRRAGGGSSGHLRMRRVATRSLLSRRSHLRACMLPAGEEPAEGWDAIDAVSVEECVSNPCWVHDDIPS